MAARWSAWVVWSALAASLVFWALRLGTQPTPMPAQVRTVDSGPALRGDILRLFANPVVASATPEMQASASSRMRLLGVVAGVGDEARGWAVLSVDGKPPRTIPVGGRVDGDWVVQTVTNRRVEIGPSGVPAVAVLDLPLPAPAATGQLPSLNPADAAQPVVPPPGLPMPPAGPVPGVPGVPGAPDPSGMQVPPGTAPDPASGRPAQMR